MSHTPPADPHELTGPTPHPNDTAQALNWASNRHAALAWFDFGVSVISVNPGSKKPAVSWDPWLDGLSRPKINTYWFNHPAHELGFIVGDKIVVFDADSPESVSALHAAETLHGIVPMLVVKTTRGEHHYYRREAGTIVRTAAHCTRDFPERVDIKTGRSLVILPPSTGKTIVKMEVSRASDLSVATQAFIDALTVGPHHTPSPTTSRPPAQTPEVMEPTWRLLHTCLRHLNPDLGYLDWFAVAAALFHTTGGCDDAYVLFDSWSADGRKYKGIHETRKLWKSLRLDHPRPRSLGTLISMLKAAGVSWDQICDESVEPFDPVDGEGEQ